MVLDNPFEQPSGLPSDRVPSNEGAALPFDRLAAHIADLVLLVPIMALAMAPFRRAVTEAKLLDNAFDSDWALLQGLVVALAVGIAWETFFISLWGTSPGRAIFGLRVVDMWTGGKPRVFNAFLRGFTWWLSVVALGAPFFGVYGNTKRRPLHDRVGDTEVRSRNTRRQSAPPRMTELAFGSLFTTGALFFASLVLTSQFVVLKEHARVADIKKQGRLCDTVTEAVKQHDIDDVNVGRIATALGLSTSGVIETSCLEVEADYALWNGSNRTLGYFAKGLIHFGRDMDESDQYFAKVCDLEPDSDACRMSGWYRDQMERIGDESAEGGRGDDTEIAQDSETVEALETIARAFVTSGTKVGRSTRAPSASPAAPDWMRLLVLRELFLKKGDPALILQLTQDPARIEAVGAKLVEYRARAMWLLDRKHEAKQMIFATADALPRQQRVALTSWLCNRELYESSCSVDASRACDMMERSASAVSGDFAVPSFLVASLRHAECRIEKGRGSTTQLAQFEKYAEEDNGRKLVESVRMLRTQERAKGLAELRKLASLKNASDDLFVTEANIRLVEEMAKRPAEDRDATRELLGLRERWFTARNARRYADWGRALFEALSKRQEWSKATEVGVILGGELEGDRTLQSRVALAAWKAGKQKLATELADSIQKSRFPASVDSDSKESSPEIELLQRIRKPGRRP